MEESVSRREEAEPKANVRIFKDKNVLAMHEKSNISYTRSNIL